MGAEKVPENPWEGFDPQEVPGFTDALIEIASAPILEQDERSFDGLVVVLKAMQKKYPESSATVLYARMTASIIKVLLYKNADLTPEKKIETLSALLTVGLLRELNRS